MNSGNLWTWRELCRAVHVEQVNGPDVRGVSIDSRTLQPGDLFVALAGDPGPRFHTASRSDRDGHAYVPNALTHGAAGLLVSRRTYTGAPELVVPDTLDGLWDLGRASRARFSGQAVAVTGSSGKTTVKEFLAAALGCPAAQGSFNNYLGVPLTLARTPADAACAVYEIGTNHPGEIAPLARLVQPHVALILNVLPVHLEYFADAEALRREKLSIAEGLVGGGTLVLLDELTDDLAGDFRRIRFGRSPEADVRLLEYDPATHVARMGWDDETLEARVPGGGEHRALSLTATVACLRALGRDPFRARDLGDALVPAGRGARRRVAGIEVIDDSYNANPVSMREALRDLHAATGRRFALLGEMLELGIEGPKFHAALAGECIGLDGVVCVGEGMRALHDALDERQRLGWYASASDVDLEALARLFRNGDSVLIKGSNRVFWTHDFVSRLVDALDRPPGARAES